ncbi:RNA methyltransferase [Halioxenophilus sp. WMMB6]|uniref:TrmH family RNA methyltransferase n=1 Tax=Halioxenophilus sp. WMMB6 TaxID=3073815 RepID=UPI00295E8AD2|nr:RNA methyltransferase [Halioxenophilus sp. WMMB6]
MVNPPQDSEAYRAKRAQLRRLLTVYGRKPVLEALQADSARAYRLHLADSNKPAPILDQIIALATEQGAEVLYHSRQQLSRISKNSKQDQGICVDLECPGFEDAHDFLANNHQRNFELLALDGITNPQNLGMIIRSATAGFVDGILLPEKGTAQIDALAIKASAGTVFKAKVLRCQSLAETLAEYKKAGSELYCLAGDGKESLASLSGERPRIYILGNETDGVSSAVRKLASHSLAIPMNNGVESLNVAVTAALLSFRKLFAG